MKIRWQAILVGLSVSVIVYLISFHLIFLNGLERSFYDFRFFFREDHSNPERYHENQFTSPARQRVIEVKGGEMVAEERWNQYQAVVVKIDDESLETFGEWPFPRDVHAQMLKAAREAGSKSTLFDVLFIVPQKVPAAITLATKDNPSLYAQMQRIYAGMDSTLAREIERSGNIYLDLSVAYQESKDPEYRARISEMETILQRHYLPIGDHNKRVLK
ncbi:MAG: CHASE2 domain-containing protein, partial [Spirochaetota bacterium]